MQRDLREVKRQPHPLSKILNDLKYRIYDFNNLLTFVEDIVFYRNRSEVDEIIALKNLIRIIAMARNEYEEEKERVRGYPVREQKRLTPPDYIYSTVMAALQNSSLQRGGITSPAMPTMILAAPILEMMRFFHLALTVDNNVFNKAFEQMRDKYFELTESDHIDPEVKRVLKVLFLHTISEIIEGEYEYREALNFCETQWSTFSNIEKKLLIESINTAIKSNEYRFKERDSGEWDYESDESATLRIDRSKKAASFAFTQFLKVIPLVELLHIRVQEIIATLNTSLQILQLTHLPLEVRRDSILLLMGKDATNTLDYILSTLEGNTENDDKDIKSTTLITLMHLYENIDYPMLQSLKQCLDMIQNYNRDQVLNGVSAKLQQWVNLSDMNKTLLQNIHSALFYENPEVILAGISCLRRHKVALEGQCERIIDSLTQAITKFTPNIREAGDSGSSNSEEDSPRINPFGPSRKALIQLRTEFETIRARRNPPRPAPLVGPPNPIGSNHQAPQLGTAGIVVVPFNPAFFNPGGGIALELQPRPTVGVLAQPPENPSRTNGGDGRGPGKLL